MDTSKTAVEKRFNNKFIYQAYGIATGEGKAMKIASQQEYTPLTHENVLAFLHSEHNLLIEKFKEIVGQDEICNCEETAEINCPHYKLNDYKDYLRSSLDQLTIQE